VQQYLGGLATQIMDSYPLLATWVVISHILVHYHHFACLCSYRFGFFTGYDNHLDPLMAEVGV